MKMGHIENIGHRSRNFITQSFEKFIQYVSVKISMLCVGLSDDHIGFCFVSYKFIFLAWRTGYKWSEGYRDV